MAREMKPVIKTLWVFVIASLGCLLSVILFVALTTSDESVLEPEHSIAGAWTICQQFVEGQLKSPASADYPRGSFNYTAHLGDGRYRVRAYVDSQNSFGAVLRNNFDCTVQHAQGDTYHLVNLAFPE